jgi:centrosomal CEP104-like protein
VAESAVDAAQSAQAGNSLEKMLCHQMAAAHRAAMKQLDRSLNSSLPPVEMARLSNSAARMRQIYQEALLTLQKLRTGGKQTVVVQHVQVSEGGQANRGQCGVW